MTGLVSLGYEGRTADGLVAALQQQQVSAVVDVRLNPISRKPGLSKRRLSERLAEESISYVHLKQLGNPKDNREPFWSGEVQAGIERFADLLTQPAAEGALEEVDALLASGERVALLCFERDHRRCHRQVVADHAVSRRPGPVEFA